MAITKLAKTVHQHPYTTQNGDSIKAQADALIDELIDINGKNVKLGAAGNTVGVVPVLHIITVADGSTVLDALTLDATYGKLTITDVWFRKGATTGGSTDAVQLCTDSGGSTAVSSSLALNTIAEGGIVRTTSLLNNVFAAGAHLYVKRTSTTNNNGTLFVSGYRTA